MGRFRALSWALAMSILAHVALMAPMQADWVKPVREIDFPIEASLIDPSPPAPVAVPVPQVAAEPVTAPPKAVDPPPKPVAPPKPEPVPAPKPEPAPVQPPPVDTPPEPVPLPPDPPPAPEPTQPVKSAIRPAIRTLPKDLTLIYKVSSSEGEQAFEIGRATYVWHSADGRYSLSSKAEPTGMMALLMSDHIVQSSEGMVDAGGLRPDRFSQQKGDRKPDTASFDWETNQVTLNGQSRVLLTTQAQDLLGFPFHLALTVREDEADFMLGVSNGRKFKEYQFRNLGKAHIEQGGRAFEVLHLKGIHPRDGELDVWLDMARSALPVRIRTVDQKGRMLEMQLDDSARAAS